jgi:hypothetical protein
VSRSHARYRHIPTSTLRACVRALLAAPGMLWLFGPALTEMNAELLRREIGGIAAKCGGFPVTPIDGRQ